MPIKWDYEAPEHKTIEQAKVEALRAIAEQLDELNDHLAGVVRAIRAGQV